MLKPILIGIVAAVVVACVIPTRACACPPALGVGIVAGRVLRADGAPAPGAVVRTSVSLRGCLAADSDLVDRDFTTAEPTGFYRYDVRAYAPSDTACVRVTAVDTAGGRQDSVTVAGIRMRLIASYGTRERPDSLRIDLLLP